MVDRLQRLDHGAERRRKVVSSRLGFAMRRLENSLCHPSSKWVPFSNKGRIRQPKERYGLRLTAIRLWETFTFTILKLWVSGKRSTRNVKRKKQPPCSTCS